MVLFKLQCYSYEKILAELSVLSHCQKLWIKYIPTTLIEISVLKLIVCVSRL